MICTSSPSCVNTVWRWAPPGRVTCNSPSISKKKNRSGWNPACSLIGMFLYPSPETYFSLTFPPISPAQIHAAQLQPQFSSRRSRTDEDGGCAPHLSWWTLILMTVLIWIHHYANLMGENDEINMQVFKPTGNIINMWWGVLCLGVVLRIKAQAGVTHFRMQAGQSSSDNSIN